MRTDIKNIIVKLTQESPNQEICGLFYINFNEFYYYPCKNISLKPEHSFEISQEEFLRVESLGEIYGIFHSHINEDSTFSQMDKDLSEEIELPIFCYSEIDKIFREYRPSGYKAKILQNEFIRGFRDCFSIVRDYYWNNFEYLFDDFNRDDSFDKNNNNLILENFELQGFKELEIKTNIKPHDVILYKSMRHAYPHHFEIFIGDSKIIHHERKKLSTKEYISSDFFSPSYKVIRFEKFGNKKNESILIG